MRSFISFLASCATAVALVSVVPIAHAEQKITWESCPENVVTAGAECGRIDVPMNYSDPDGKKISVGFVKLPAKEKSRGSLFVNPGGPGVSVYALFATDPVFGQTRWPEDMRNEWDIVAVQPRGLEGSTPLECAPVMDMSVDKISNLGALTKAECDRSNPGYAENVNTENTASDWNEVRRALGEEKISIFGMSYGTFLGSVYATKFPQHTDKVVLDAGFNMDLTANFAEQLRVHAAEDAYTDFFTWVAKHDDVYHMGTTPGEVYEKWAERVMAESGASPTVPPPNADDFQRVGTDLKGLFTQIASGGGNQENSPALQLTDALVGEPIKWPHLAKSISSPAPVEPQESGEEENAMPGMVICNDRKTLILADHLLAGVWAQVTGNPIELSHLLASGIQCGGIEPTQPARDISGAELATKPLQIQATRDPNTPYSNFTEMSDAMQSYVVTVEGSGHVQGGTGNKALNKIIGEYLRSGKVNETRIAGIDPKPE